MSIATEVARLDGTDQAKLIERKEVAPLELVEAAIERIARLNPKINAVIHTLFDQARAAAQNPSSLPKGPFRGVPFLLKNLLASCAGAPLTSGSAFLSRYSPDFDSVIVSRLKRAGLIILGQTNTPEFGLLPTTEPRLYGPTHNPWALDRTAGGSSGGSAAAVASRMVPMAHANDGGGSIRMPASCCGIFGLKPTRGRISLGPSAGEGMGGLVVEHAVTISVRDSAALLDVTAGPSPGDPYCAPPTERPFLEEAGRDPGKLRIAFSTSSLIGTPVHADCVRAVQESAKLCSELRHELSEAAPPLDGQQLMEAFMTVWAGGSAAGIDAAAALTGQAPAENQFEPSTWNLYQLGRCITASQYVRALEGLHSVSRAVAHFMERYDVWLTPVLGSPPEPLGWLNGPPLEAQERTAAFAAFTPLANATGQPAMSVPLYWNGEGLPIGAHFTARHGEEAVLFRLAGQLEGARPWAGKIPPTSALSAEA